MAYEDYTVKEFINAWFKKDRSLMNEETFNLVYAEYIDTAGLYETEEFEKIGYINYLNGRINSIKIGIRLQKDFINNFDAPFLPDLERFKKFGHILYWNKNDKDRIKNFLDALSKIEDKEKRYISELESSIKELKEIRLKKNSGEKPPEQTRQIVVRTINSLGKLGYRINSDRTTVEEFSLMIKQQREIEVSQKTSQ